MPQRKYKFRGPDPAYIKHLEEKVEHLTEKVEYLTKLINTANAQPYPSPDQTGMCNPVSSNSEGPVTSGIQFVEYTPPCIPTPVPMREKNTPKWMKQLKVFIEGILTATQLEKARKLAGIDTPARNQTALKLILGHGGVHTFPEDSGTTVFPPILPTARPELVVQGCLYGKFITRCARDHKFTTRVVDFQKLVFCSFCVVMMGVGVSKKATDDMMRRYLGEAKEDLTLEKYRHGAVWANRCMAALLENGWGCETWEFFLLESRGPAQFSRFAASDTDSYKIVANRLGVQEMIRWEPGWIPYCLPCIVHYLTGYTVPLTQICIALGYGPVPLSKVQLMSGAFTQSLNHLFSVGEAPGVLPAEQDDMNLYLFAGTS